MKIIKSSSFIEGVWLEFMYLWLYIVLDATTIHVNEVQVGRSMRRADLGSAFKMSFFQMPFFIKQFSKRLFFFFLNGFNIFQKLFSKPMGEKTVDGYRLILQRFCQITSRLIMLYRCAPVSSHAARWHHHSDPSECDLSVTSGPDASWSALSSSQAR